MADETYRQASTEFDETPPLDSDELDEGDADEEFGGGDDEEDEGVD